MEFKGCTTASNEDVVSAVNNYSDKIKLISKAVQMAKLKYIDDHKGKTVSCGFLYLSSRPATKHEILYEDVSWFEGEYRNLESKLLELGYLDYTQDVEDLCNLTGVDMYFKFKDTASKLYSLSKSGNIVYVTPEQACFISRFK